MPFLSREHMDTPVADLPLNQTVNLVCQHEEPLHIGIFLVQGRKSSHFCQLISKPGYVRFLNIAAIKYIRRPVKWVLWKSPPTRIVIIGMLRNDCFHCGKLSPITL